MIRFSAALVIVGLGLLLAGAIASNMTLVYAAIAVSVCAGLVLVAGIIAGRDELFGRGATAAGAKRTLDRGAAPGPGAAAIPGGASGAGLRPLGARNLAAVSAQAGTPGPSYSGLGWPDGQSPADELWARVDAELAAAGASSREPKLTKDSSPDEIWGRVEQELGGPAPWNTRVAIPAAEEAESAEREPGAEPGGQPAWAEPAGWAGRPGPADGADHTQELVALERAESDPESGFREASIQEASDREADAEVAPDRDEGASDSDFAVSGHAEAAPDAAGVAPGGDEAAPGGDEAASASGGAVPEHAGAVPDAEGFAPGGDEAASASGGAVPEHAGVAPDAAGAAPGRDEAAPGGDEAAPGGDEAASASGGAVPEHAGVAPDAAGAAPGRDEAVPGGGGAVREHAGAVPDAAGAAPGRDDSASDGTAPDGTAPAGTAPDGTAPDGTAPDGAEAANGTRAPGMDADPAGAPPTVEPGGDPGAELHAAPLVTDAPVSSYASSAAHSPTTPYQPGTPYPPATPYPRAAQDSAGAWPGPAAPRPSAAPGSPHPDRPAGSGAESDLVIVVSGVPRYHRPGCILIRFLGEDDVESVTRKAAEASGCVPCRACHPDKLPPVAESGALG